MKRPLLLPLLFILAACAPFAPPSPVPFVVSSATPFLAPSYPTLAATPQAISPAANGVQVTVGRVWRDGKQVNAEVCFSLPDTSDWSIWSAGLKFGETEIREYGTTLLNRQDPLNGQAGQRCDLLSFFNIPPDADLSATTLTIDSIAAPPRDDEYCTVYMPKIQQALNERGIAIVLQCSEVNGVMTMQIASIPPEMSREQAEQIVFSDEFYTIKGPWVFTFNLGQ